MRLKSVSRASHDAIFGNRRPSTRSKARLGKVEEEGKSLEANSKRDLSGPLLYLPWLCPPLTCVNTSVQMRMYTNIHHHLHDPHGRIKPSHLCARKTSEYCVMDILCTCNFVRIYMHEERFAEVRVGRAYTRNILMEICFFQFLSACPPPFHAMYNGICRKQKNAKMQVLNYACLAIFCSPGYSFPR